MTIIRSDAVKRHKLRTDVAAILADVPDAADHTTGITFLMDEVLDNRMAREIRGFDNSPVHKHPDYFAIPNDLRSRLAKELNRAIADSELPARDAWPTYYAPLSDIKKGNV